MDTPEITARGIAILRSCEGDADLSDTEATAMLEAMHERMGWHLGHTPPSVTAESALGDAAFALEVVSLFGKIFACQDFNGHWSGRLPSLSAASRPLAEMAPGLLLTMRDLVKLCARSAAVQQPITMGEVVDIITPFLSAYTVAVVVNGGRPGQPADAARSDELLQHLAEM